MAVFAFVFRGVAWSSVSAVVCRSQYSSTPSGRTLTTWTARRSFFCSISSNAYEGRQQHGHRHRCLSRPTDRDEAMAIHRLTGHAGRIGADEAGQTPTASLSGYAMHPARRLRRRDQLPGAVPTQRTRAPRPAHQASQPGHPVLFPCCTGLSYQEAVHRCSVDLEPHVTGSHAPGYWITCARGMLGWSVLSCLLHPQRLVTFVGTAGMFHTSCYCYASSGPHHDNCPPNDRMVIMEDDSLCWNAVLHTPISV